MRYPFSRNAWRLRWYHLVVIALGLGAIVAIIYLALRTGWLAERLGRTGVEPEMIGEHAA